MKKISIIAVLFALQVLAQSKNEKLDHYLTFLTKEKKFMGSVLISHEGKKIFDKNYGYQNLENNVVINSNTQFKIGEITRAFTAVLIMKLVENQRLKLDTKLSKFYKDIPYSEDITINDLLHHSSRIYNLSKDSLFLKTIKKNNSKKEIISLLTKKNPDYESSKKNEINPTNYILLGYIIEDITKINFNSNVETKIINKLNLKNTSFYPKLDVSKSFKIQNEQYVLKNNLIPNYTFSDNGLYSTTNDLIVFMNALVNGKLISKESLESMKKIENGVGKGLFSFQFGDKVYYEQNGKIEYFTSNVFHNFEDNLTVSILNNTISSYDNNEIKSGILSLYYNIPFKFPFFKNIKLDENKVKKYVGTYKSSKTSITVEIFYVNDKLIAKSSKINAYELFHYENETYYNAQAKFEITFGENSLILKENEINIDFEKK